ncbi:gram-negative pili assembly chaperone, C-terminal domain protein (plasmid) [Klebsiella oxytoca]|uniref:fimbria/pilus periplasmic chaperone n=1 Tax=Klebsiella oxytoca TaxID=571 RepID=UPI000D52761C|nr:fimbria/pilus periplasmic chaperone [Klebsiella oxytoca]AWF33375.1 gram-negative pili assembly chaperone, C-terminal domain protein [Klebsiella oxytoca]
MSNHLFCSALRSAVISAACLVSSLAQAGGITLGGTRVIYPAGQKQVSLSVRNTSDQSSFMVQSWVEQADGKKSQDFVVTPPLYVSGPGNENTLRLMYAGHPVRTDQESLYYFNAKAIPSMDKKMMEGKNVLMLAAVTRIKLFVRPAGLSPAVDKAPGELTFHRSGGQMRIDNPTPYHITLALMKVGGQKLVDTMVSPRGSVSLPLPAGAGNTVTFRTINDFGAVTPELRATLE